MALEIHLRLYEELNDFLPSDKRKRRFAFTLDRAATVKQLLSCLKVPHDQVELVLVNGDSVGFSHRLKDGDSVSVYPVFESLDVATLVRVRKKPLRRTRFVAGPGLVRLARYLRSMGFDTCKPDFGTREVIVRLAEEERRILLTKDPSFLKCARLSRVYIVRAARPRDQLIEVLSRFDLLGKVGFSTHPLCIIHHQ